MPKGRLCRVALEREQVGESFAMLLGATEQALRGVDPADVEMQVVLPRISDPSVDLNAVLRDLAGRVAGARLRNGGGAGRIRIVGIEAHRRPVRRSAGALELQQVVGALVLHGLETANGYVELLAHLRVVDGRVENPARGTECLRSQRYCRD